MYGGATVAVFHEQLEAILKHTGWVPMDWCHSLWKGSNGQHGTKMNRIDTVVHVAATRKWSVIGGTSTDWGNMIGIHSVERDTGRELANDGTNNESKRAAGK